MKYRYLLFDLDGTLVNSELGIVNCFKHALSVMGKPIPSNAFFRRVIGPPLDRSFREFFQMNEEEVAFAVKTYRERYSVLGVLEYEPIFGAGEALKALKERGYTLLLATSKPEVFARRILENSGWIEYFTVVCGSDFEKTLKTKTDVIEEALRRGNISSRGECAIIGDRCYDVIGGKNANIHTVGIRVGFAEEGELENSGADLIAQDFSDLLRLLNE